MVGKGVLVVGSVVSTLILIALVPAMHMRPAPSDAKDESAPQTMQFFLEEFRGLPGLPPLPSEWSVERRAAYVLSEHAVLGRTPGDWLDWVHDALPKRSSSDASPSVLPIGLKSLDAAVLQMYAAVGVTPTSTDLARARVAAASLPLSLQDATADLLGVVANGYALQRLLAKEVTSEPRLTERTQGLQPELAQQERDEMAQRAQRIMSALRTFQVRTQGLGAASALSSATCLVPVLTDCLVYEGTSGSDSYPPNPGLFPDPVLIIEPGGNDTYTNGAGAANPSGFGAAANHLALSIVYDESGNDDYLYEGEPIIVQGSAFYGGIGLLIDLYGDDEYVANFTRVNTGPIILPGIGNGDSGAQGYGYAGVGILLDEWGDDVYDFRVASAGRCIWGWAQGVGGGGGLGISSDLWGNDDWLATGRGTGTVATQDCSGTGSGGAAVQGVYVQGVGVVGGVGIMTDTGVGDDVYLLYNNGIAPDVYAQGWSAAGLGIMYDDGGTDEFVSSVTASEFILPNLNCVFGAGELQGVAVLWVGAGPTTYLTETTGPETASSMAEGWGLAGYGLFIDEDGVDDHVIRATAPTTSIAGRGATALSSDPSLFGTYLDDGGDTDTYTGPPTFWVGAGPGPNNSVWDGGVDR
jgi:hypothetical protein